MDTAELSQRTKEAIRRGQQEAARRMAEKIAEDEQKQEAWRYKANAVVEAIPGLAEEQATLGNNKVTVYKLEYGVDYKSSRRLSQDGQGLSAVSELVWEYCCQAGLLPTVELWHDGEGKSSGHKIVIHW